MGGSGVLDEKILESTLVQNWHWMSSPATVVSSFPRPSPQTDISSQTPLSRVVRRLKVFFIFYFLFFYFFIFLEG
jgi:hypothetical protein